MDKEDLIKLFDEYGWTIMGHNDRGNYSMPIESALEIYEKYGFDSKKYKIEQEYDMTLEEYEEYENLMESETSYFSILCSGINKNGSRCQNTVDDIMYEEPKKVLEKLRQKHYCKKHQYQKDELYQKAKEYSK